MSKPNRLVVLGAAGFIGKHILAERPDAIALTRREVDLTTPGAGKKLAQLLRDGDTVVFLSAITPDKEKGAQAFLQNCQMGAEVALATDLRSAAQLVYISSDAVFAEDLPQITEDTIPCPNTLYGTMHLAREQMMAEASARTKTPLLILRPCAAYGSGDTHQSYGQNRFIPAVAKKEAIRLFGEGEEMRPHVHVQDVVQVMLELIQLEAKGVFHVIPSPSISFRRIAEIVSQAVGGCPIEVVPRSGVPTHKHFDSKRLRESLPSFQFLDLSTEIQNILRKG
jgi:nucleoside-diphosphate-sugar epimerase